MVGGQVNPLGSIIIDNNNNDVTMCKQAKHDSYWSGQEIQRPQSFALQSTSFKDFPFLNEITGKFLNIFLSKGWFCIRCHLFIRICLRSGIDGWYSVTNGKILQSDFCLFCRADILWLKLTSDRVMRITPVALSCLNNALCLSNIAFTNNYINQMKFQYKIPDSPCLRRTLSFCRSRRHINSCTSLERS